jgi:hypothetical protein
MKALKLIRTLAAVALVFVLGVPAFADTIRMKDGQVIRGQIVAFRDQQFTVLIGSSRSGNRRSRITLYMEDVESIEFEGADGTDTSSATDTGTYNPPVDNPRTQPTPQPTPRREEPRQSAGQRPPVLGNDSGTSPTRTNPPANTQAPARTSTDSPFFPVRVRVRADNAANGWTDSGLMVRKGQRLRITATGRVSLGEGRFSTPTGLPRVVDTEKLMRNEPTGELIAVIGDDNDEFIAVGANREFHAPRDGRLFLGVNEGKLEDNTGSYDALIEVEPMTGVGSGGR